MNQEIMEKYKQIVENQKTQGVKGEFLIKFIEKLLNASGTAEWKNIKKRFWSFYGVDKEKISDMFIDEFDFYSFTKEDIRMIIEFLKLLDEENFYNSDGSINFQKLLKKFLEEHTVYRFSDIVFCIQNHKMKNLESVCADFLIKVEPTLFSKKNLYVLTNLAAKNAKNLTKNEFLSLFTPEDREKLQILLKKMEEYLLVLEDKTEEEIFSILFPYIQKDLIVLRGIKRRDLLLLIIELLRNGK